MSTRPPQESPGLLDHLAIRYLRRGLDTSHPADEPYVMSDEESFLVQRAYVATLAITMLAGLFTILFFQLPQLFWPAFFASTDVTLSAYVVSVPIVTWLYALLLLYMMVHLTANVNRIGARAIAQICQFPRIHDARYEYHAEKMIGLVDSKLRAALMHPRSGLFLYFLLNLAAGLLVSTIVVSLTGPYITGLVAIILSSVLYGIWGIYQSKRVLYELKIRIMAPLTIRNFVNELREEWHDDEPFQAVLTDALHYTGVLDRQHIYANLLLVETLLDRVSTMPLPHTPNAFTAQMAALPVAIQRSIERLLIFSVLIDGHFTARKRRQLRHLKTLDLLPTYTLTDITRLYKDYRAGKGLWL